MGDERRLRQAAPRSDRHDALETLTTAVRGLIEATVTTGHDPERLRALAADVDDLTRKLVEAVDDDPWPARSYGPGVTDAPSLMGINPAIGNCNPIAPVVELKIGEDAAVEGRVRFGVSHVGPPYRAHGGVVASVFDQVLGVATIAAGSPGMTASMTVTYRRATPLHEDLRVEASFAGVEGRTSRARGAIYDTDGRITAEAVATFIQPREAIQ